MLFKASSDGVAKVFTATFTFLLLSVVVWQVYIFFNEPQLNSIIASFFLLAILLIPIYYNPISYHINAGKVIIKRPLKNVVIPKSEIENVRLVDEHEMKGTLRSFAVAESYGYFGRFSNLTSGSMHWYATQPRNYILIQTRNKKSYMLTPDYPVDFVEVVSFK